MALGLALVPFLCWWTLKHELIHGGSEFVEASLVVIAVFSLFSLVLLNEALRRWAPTYRRATWARALEAQGLDDGALAEALADRFAAERRARHRVFADVEPALAELAKRYSLALVTNGASCLQQEKLDSSGLRPFFEIVVVSAEFGVGKPDASIFRHAVSRLAEPHEQAVMLGDSLARDIDGAQAAGLRAIWINRLGHARPPDRRELAEVSTLGEAVAMLSNSSFRAAAPAPG